ncbi:class I SAM-dependent methyltransferase [Acidianus sp. HS-5]|uniref:class I SAM-dependent methyltransferase n=1 Tax=Acidianus sp. HS-5 TaxID=2886040 RepID=UPI001F351C19|nr:class I SAM-dependent methyltransferase [Acidianus sp. HS-5]BDC18305.1 methyltransferase [Acidianus sp. HS-5]
MEIFNDPQGYLQWYKRNEMIYESELRAVKKLNLSNCLDIGAGPSIFHEAMKGKIISLDISDAMLKLTNSSEYKIQADALHLPLRDKAVECTFISVTICFISDVEKMLQEIHRVTKKEFSVCIVPSDSSWGSYYTELGKKGHKYYSKAHFISKSELLSLIQKYFEIKDTISTLTYSPFDEPRVEDPREGIEGSYICVKAIPKT